MHASARRQYGVTLVELMVALVLSMILMTGVITVFVANKRTYQVQDALARLQENGRYATYSLIRDIREAGYWGCGSKTQRLTNTLNVAAGDYVYSYDEPVDGFEATGTSTWTPTLDASIPDAIGGSDVLTVRRSDGAGARVTQHNTASADLKVVAHADLKDGDIAMVSDCEDSAIFEITQVQNVSEANTNIVHNTGESDGPGNKTKNLGKKYTNGEIVRLRTRTYYVRTGTGGEPALWMIENGDASELVEGVEQMQVLYGVDGDDDDNADDYVTAQAVNAAGDWPNVVSVRISLLLRSLRDNVTDAPQTYTFNGEEVTAADKRLRQVFTATIAIRNQLG